MSLRTLCLLTLILAGQVPTFAAATLVFSTGKSALPGNAYRSDRQEFLGAQCVQGTFTPTGAADSSLRLDQTISESQLSTELGFAIGGRARFGVTEASLAANFLERSASNAFSVSAIYNGSYNLAPEKLAASTFELTKIGTSVSRPEQFDRWIQTCGDSFVDEIRRGAKLFISIRVDFSSTEQKKEFSSNFSISGPIGSASASLQQATKKYGSNVKVTVSAYQLGGDVTKVSAIFGNKDGLTSFTSCTLGKFESCATVLANALVYATDTVNGFPSQLATGQKPGAAVLAYGVSSYKDYGLYNTNPPGLAETVQISRDSLAKTFEVAYRQRVTADRLLQLPLSTRRKVAVTMARDQINSNIDTIIKTSRTCYEEAARCFDAVNHLKLSDVDSEALYPDSFSTLCVDTLKADTNDPLRMTIRSIVGIFDSDPQLVDAMDCKIYERLATQLRMAFLDKRRLKDIAPFASLGNLERVSLDGNDIADISPLGNLENLEYLSIDGNRITDLTSLANLPIIDELSLAGNRIIDIRPLSSLMMLKTITLANNQIVDVSPLAELPRMEFVDLEGNNVKDLSPMKAPLRLKCINLSGNLLTQTQVDQFMKSYRKTITVFNKGYAKAKTNAGLYCDGMVIEK